MVTNLVTSSGYWSATGAAISRPFLRCRPHRYDPATRRYALPSAYNVEVACSSQAPPIARQAAATQLDRDAWILAGDVAGEHWVTA
jgi:hypothetical protein